MKQHKKEKMKNRLLILLILTLVITPVVYAAIDTKIWDETSSTIIITSDLPYCSRTDIPETTVWYEKRGDSFIPTGSSFEDCYRENGEPTQGCCPYDYTCDEDKNECVSSIGAQGCFEYTTQQKCNALYDPEVAKYDVEITKEKGAGFCDSGIIYNTGCFVLTKCRCYWENGNCESEWYYNDSCLSSEDGVCKYKTTVTNKCNTTGVIETAWTANWTGSDNEKEKDCNSDSSTTKCLSTALLPFFSIYGIIILVILIIFYYLIKKTRKNKKASKKRK